MNLARNIFVTLLARILLLGLAVASSVVVVRSLGPEGRGLFALVLLLPELARGIGLLGFDQANAIYAGLEPTRRQALVWQSVVIAVVLGVVFAGAGVMFLVLGAPGFPTLIKGPLWLYVIPLATLPTALLAEFWQAILRGMNRILRNNVIDVGTKVATLILLVIFVPVLGLGVAGVVWANAVIALGTIVLLILQLRRVGAWGKPTFNGPMLRRATRFALPAYAGNVAAYLNYRADEFIIAAFLPAEQLGFYAVAVGLVERIWIVPGAVSTALLPHLANSEKRDPLLSAMIARHVMLWVGGACLLLFALAGVVVQVLYSSAFDAAIAPLRWLLPGILALSVARVVLAEVIVREKPLYASMASAVAVVVNIGANLILVPRMGISGASLASSISYTLLAVLWVWLYLRESRVRWTALVPSTRDLMVYTGLLARSAPSAR